MIEAYLFALPFVALYAFIGSLIAVTVGYLVWRFVLCNTCFITLLSRCSFLSILDWGIDDAELYDPSDSELL